MDGSGVKGVGEGLLGGIVGPYIDKYKKGSILEYVYLSIWYLSVYLCMFSTKPVTKYYIWVYKKICTMKR